MEGCEGCNNILLPNITEPHTFAAIVVYGTGPSAELVEARLVGHWREWNRNSVRKILYSINYILKFSRVTGVEGGRGAARHSGNIMSPVLSKEGKSDGSRYKKIQKYERHEESGLSRFLFPLDETDSVHLSHLPFFLVAPEKDPTEPSLSPFLSTCLSPAFPAFPSLSVPLPG